MKAVSGRELARLVERRGSNGAAMRIFGAAILFFVFAAPAYADQACLVDALQNYNRLKVAAMEGSASTSVLSPETIVGLRRMEELYCYRVAYCLIGDPKEVSSRQIPYAAEFTKCLREEALERYDAIERK